jgi:hypothetical protein
VNTSHSDEIALDYVTDYKYLMNTKRPSSSIQTALRVPPVVDLITHIMIIERDIDEKHDRFKK